MHSDVEDIFGYARQRRADRLGRRQRARRRRRPRQARRPRGRRPLDARRGKRHGRGADGLGERVLCGDGNDTVTADDIDALGDACENVTASGELVRDLDNDGISKPEDCNDADPAIRPGAADAPERRPRPGLRRRRRDRSRSRPRRGRDPVRLRRRQRARRPRQARDLRQQGRRGLQRPRGPAADDHDAGARALHRRARRREDRAAAGPRREEGHARAGALQAQRLPVQTAHGSG